MTRHSVCPEQAGLARMNMHEAKKPSCFVRHLRDRTKQFKTAIASWVVVASLLVGFVVWWFVSTYTAQAVDNLSWRMVGVVRTLAVEQSQSFFKYPKQAVQIARVANLRNPAEVQRFSSMAFNAVDVDVVKVGLESQGGFIAYTRLQPSNLSPVTLQISTTLVDGEWTRIDSHAIVNDSVVATPFMSSDFVTKNQSFYQQATSGTVGTWLVAGELVPVLTYAEPVIDTSVDPPELLGVVASDLVVAMFVSNVIGFLKNVSPHGEIYIATRAGIPLVASGGVEHSVLVTSSLVHLTNIAGGDLNNLQPMVIGTDTRLDDFQVNLDGDEYYVMWELMQEDDLELNLVMVLSRRDFREEIDQSYTQLMLVLLFAGPSVFVASIIVSVSLVSFFLNKIRRSLRDNVNMTEPTPAEDILSPKDQTTRSRSRSNSRTIPGDANMEQTPMTSVVGVLKALRTSLPSDDQLLLDRVIHKLLHSTQGELYTPHIIVQNDNLDLRGISEGIFTMLRPASSDRPGRPGTARPGTARPSTAIRPYTGKRPRTSIMPNVERNAGHSSGEPARVLALTDTSSVDASEPTPRTERTELLTSRTHLDGSTEGEGVGAFTPAMTGPPLEMEVLEAIFDESIMAPSPVDASVLDRCRDLVERLNVDSWGFDVFQWSREVPHPLACLAVTLMDRMGLIVAPSSSNPVSPLTMGSIAISWEQAWTYFKRIEDGYMTNITYHTAVHATDTVHGVHYMISEVGMSNVVDFSPLDKFTLLFAAAIHDFRHPGVNNNFLVTTSHPLAIRYNDKSVLENFHVASAFQLMAFEGLDLLKDMTHEDAVAVRSLAITIVLATDLALSFDIVGQFKLSFGDSTEPLNLEGDKEIKEAKTMLLKMAMKCCDVASGTKPFRLHDEWSRRVTEEFYMQGDMEKALELPVAQFMDSSECNLAKSQQGFLNFVVKPIYSAWVAAFPLGREMITNLTENVRIWKEMEDYLADDSSGTTGSLRLKPVNIPRSMVLCSVYKKKMEAVKKEPRNSVTQLLGPPLSKTAPLPPPAGIPKRANRVVPKGGAWK